MRFRQYDAIPLAPQNLAVSKSGNNHPLLSWLPNQEPDLDHYVVYKSTGGWHSIYETTSTSYEDPTETYCILQPPQYCEGTHDVFYYVKAVDIGSHVSDASNTVKASVSGQYPDKISVTPDLNETGEYSLWQNYPNPFNPNTAINYSIKSNGLVTLKVYDILGTEVASLVNEVKEPGNYSVTFNAANLPSGMYVYILSTGNFMDTKKLILLK